MEEKSNQYEDLLIGGQMYAVHRKYADEKINGGKVIVCRIKTFENKTGKIIPVLTEVGNAKRIVDYATHYFYKTLTKAVDQIKGPDGRI